MKPNPIILVRHGESEGIVDKSVDNVKPDYVPELIRHGKLHAREAGSRIKGMVGDESLFFMFLPCGEPGVRLSKLFRL